MYKIVTTKNFEDILGFELNSEVKNKINSFNLEYRDLTNQERDAYILDVVNVLTNEITVSGKHRISEWENGWDENFNLFVKSGNIDDLIPKYHGKNKIVRWMGETVMPITENFDYKIHICFVDAILNHFVKKHKNLMEFGCGPGYHLLRFKNYSGDMNLYGLDWTKSSQNIINSINKKLNSSIFAENFDFFNPKLDFEIPQNTAVFTVAALEQVGNNFEKFISFLLEKKPELVINMEPIDELLDNNKLIDSLSIKYFRKRNYLNNFLPYLEKLERDKKIEIIDKRRIFSGSYFIEGHSLIVWKPL